MFTEDPRCAQPCDACGPTISGRQGTWPRAIGLARTLAGRIVIGIGIGVGIGTLAHAGSDSPGSSGITPDRSGVAGSPATLSFEKHIRPILKAHCFDCHGEGDTLRGGLDLRLVRFMQHGGESGPALIPGKAEESRLYALVKSGEMPKRERKPTAREIELLRQWIQEGATTTRPEPESLPAGMQITAEEQNHWSFQPLRRPEVPQAAEGRFGRNPIDAFVAARFPAEGVTFSPEAPRRVLLRRAFLDLVGIPPTPEELDAFTDDPRPDAYERWLDRLLASPRYGERWARHWLDIAGYADSDGYTSDDNVRPYAYKYRDYVIRALNEDKPFDQFLQEQIAGDELARLRVGSPEAAMQEPAARECMIATGYLRMAADGTATGGVDQETARNQVVADTLKIVTSGLLGLTVGCAQCHDHRYDPIPQADYYRLRAVFEPAYDWKNWRTPGQRLLSLYTPEDRQRAADVEELAAKLGREKEAKQNAFIDEALKKHLEKFEANLRDPLWNAFKTPAAQRSEEQKRLLADHPSVNINPGVLYQYNAKAAEELKAMDARIGEIRARKPAEDFVSALWEPGGPPPATYRFHRGDPKQPKEEIPPGTLSVLGSAARSLPCDSVTNSTGRRLAFANWLTSPQNPLLPRVWVNRVWLHHFGRGLVGTPADFGMQGEAPSHPELLEWLASTFSAAEGDHPAREGVGLGWRLKALHRLIMTSRTYRQSTDRGAAESVASTVDPENRSYWRKPVQRLDAEAIRDSYLAVSGALSSRMFGPPVPVREDVVGQVVVGIDRKQGDNKMPVEVPMGEEEFRRGVYLEVRRSKPLAFLNAFDAPVMEVNCERRASSTVAPQALMLMNSDFVLQQAEMFAKRVRELPGESSATAVERAWRLAYGRSPTADEVNKAREFLARQIATLDDLDREAARSVSKRESGLRGGSSEQRAMRSLCQALLTSNEFLYVD